MAPRQDPSPAVRKPPENGPGEKSDPAADNEHRPTSSDDEPIPKIYNTGDSDVWPSYDLPLVFEIEVLEFPEEITRPSAPIPNDDD